MTAESVRSPLRQVAFKPHLRVEVVPGKTAYLISARGVTVLRGGTIAALAPLLDGTRDLDRLHHDAGAAHAALTPARTTELIARLADAGLITDSTANDRAPGASAEQAYWELAGLDGRRAAHRTSAALVRPVILGSVDARAVHSALDTARLQSTGATAVPADRAELTLVACDNYLDPALAAIDAEQRAAGRPWLLFKPGGTTAWIGPVFQPGTGTACWSCLSSRIRLNLQAETHVQRVLDLPGPVQHPPSAHPAGQAAALNLAAMEAAKWLAGERNHRQNSLWTMDSLSMETRSHPVQRRPQCPECGDPGLVAAQVNSPVVLVPRPKAMLDGGDHRSAPPQHVLDTYQHLVSPLTGVVRELRRDERGPAFLNCFRAGQNPATASRDLATVRAGLRTWSSGKGTTPLHAKVSALCEALERNSGYYQGDEPTLRATLRELGPDAVHPDSVQLFHERQFADPGRSDPRRGVLNQVCEPFDENQAMDWTPVWSLTHQRQRLMPTAMLYYQAPQGPGRASCQATSNGTAAGTSREDAIVQGFLELVERDSVALWWYNRLRRPAVDLDAFGDPWIDELRSVHTGLKRTVWALDLTADLGIPTVVALSRRTDQPVQDIVMGFGAHFDPRVALRRALSELNQMLPVVLDATPDGRGYGCDEEVALEWWRNATLAREPYLVPAGDLPATTPTTHRYRPGPDLREDVIGVERLLRRHGLELLVLDQTRPDLGLPVVKVVVPGLRPFWTRFAPGRLYDVPVRLGWLDSPTRYEDLNPIPFFL